MQFNVPVTGITPVTVMVKGEFGQVTPGGKVPAVTMTDPVKPPLGVTVIVEAADAPVAETKIRGVELTVKVGPVGAVTLKAVLVALVKPAALAVSV